MNLKLNSKIFLAGHKGMVGSAILRVFKEKNYKRIITVEKKKLNFLDQKKTESYLKKIKPDFIIIAAARVGGILANKTHKGEFIYENLMIQTNLINGAFKAGVKKLIFLGSSCVYPKHAKQPLKENYLLSGSLEETNDAYAIAKIAGISMCKAYNQQYNVNYISLMPTNLYGPNDNYDEKKSHFFPAIIKKIHLAKKNNKKYIYLWGNGKPKRELMYVDDLAYACEFFLKKNVKEKLINIGSGDERTILQFYRFVMDKLKCNLKVKFDKKKLNGTPRKVLNCNLARSYGWKHKISLADGFDLTYKDFLKNKKFNI